MTHTIEKLEELKKITKKIKFDLQFIIKELNELKKLSVDRIEKDKIEKIKLLINEVINQM